MLLVLSWSVMTLMQYTTNTLHRCGKLSSSSGACASSLMRTPSHSKCCRCCPGLRYASHKNACVCWCKSVLFALRVQMNNTSARQQDVSRIKCFRCNNHRQLCVVFKVKQDEPPGALSYSTFGPIMVSFDRLSEWWTLKEYPIHC